LIAEMIKAQLAAERSQFQKQKVVASCELSLGCPSGPDRGSWSCEASAILGRTG
jgi:hypothetical protein